MYSRFKNLLSLTDKDLAMTGCSSSDMADHIAFKVSEEQRLYDISKKISSDVSDLLKKVSLIQESLGRETDYDVLILVSPDLLTYMLNQMGSSQFRCDDTHVEKLLNGEDCADSRRVTYMGFRVIESDLYKSEGYRLVVDYTSTTGDKL